MHTSELTGIADERKQRCDDAAEQYRLAIDVIKEALRQWEETQDDKYLYTAAEAWNEIPRVAMMDLWLAPSKGGVFTTMERHLIRFRLPGGF